MASSKGFSAAEMAQFAAMINTAVVNAIAVERATVAAAPTALIAAAPKGPRTVAQAKDSTFSRWIRTSIVTPMNNGACYVGNKLGDGAEIVEINVVPVTVAAVGYTAVKTANTLSWGQRKANELALACARNLAANALIQ